MRSGGVRNGFTLIELMVVIMIVGLIGATAAIRLSGVSRRARLESAVVRIVAADARLRTHCAMHGVVAGLNVRLGEGQLRSWYDEHEDSATVVDLGQGVRVMRYMSLTRDERAGEVTVAYSPQGTSETFATELGFTNGDSVWLMVAGLTGQVTRLEDERDIENVFETIRKVRIDAD